MVKRVKLEEPPDEAPDDAEQAGAYFLAPACDFFSSGCTLLDQVLGGGWVEGRMINIVGDKSTGKTLLAIEASANYKIKYPKGKVEYVEVEAAFDRPYAETIGLPSEGVNFPPDIFTVQDLFKHLDKVIKTGERTLVIVDSLDALSDDDEQAAKIEDSTYGTGKAKWMSRLFRQLNQKLSKSKVTLIIISQVRDNIGVTFGKSHTRSGGKALDFYASQIIWLAHTGRLERQRAGVKRAYGVKVKASCEKNKVGSPFRKCDFELHFAFGIEDVLASASWLLEVGEHKRCFDSKAECERFIKGIDKLDDDAYFEEQANLAEAVREAWKDIERAHLPRRRKYKR